MEKRENCSPLTRRKLQHPRRHDKTAEESPTAAGFVIKTVALWDISGKAKWRGKAMFQDILFPKMARFNDLQLCFYFQIHDKILNIH